MKKLILLFPQKKWGIWIMSIGAIIIIIFVATIQIPTSIYHILLYLFGIAVFVIGIVRYENYEPENDSS